jgi:4-hydroxy-tetrahydrodipicolinate synthase
MTDKRSINWGGVFPAATTQMDADGKIDLQQTQHCLEKLIEGGVRGLVMLGMVGESGVMDGAEKFQVLELAKSVAAGRVPVIAGLAEKTTEAACQYAAECSERNLDGLMVFPPLGYRPDRAETLDFYREVAKASSLPILIYNNPSAYGVDITPDLLSELVAQDTIVAIKEETYDVRRVTDIANLLGDRVAILCGVDDLVVESAVLGAVGWVSGMANAYPKESVELLDHCISGRWDEARRLYRILTPVYHLDTHVKLVQYIKLAGQMRGLGCENVRAPRLVLSGDERRMVEEIVTRTESALQSLQG